MKNMDISVRPLLENDLPQADYIFRLAFGTFLELPDPLQFAGDTATVHTRWKADPSAALGAEVNGRLVASNFLTQWGSIGLFGPLTVHPDYWDKGIAKALLQETMKIFSKWKVMHAGLFTHAESPKHIALYQKFGFWPRYLTAIMSFQIRSKRSSLECVRLSEASNSTAARLLEHCSKLTGEIHQGLNVTREIYAVNDQKLGDTLMLFDGSQLVGFAVCHCGAGTEAGSGACYLKFAAVRPGKKAEEYFRQILMNCEAFASALGIEQLIAGVNMARHRAYQVMMNRGYRIFRLGVAMQKPNEAAYNRDECYVIDDWR